MNLDGVLAPLPVVSFDPGGEIQIVPQESSSPVAVYSARRTAVYYSLSESEVGMLEQGYSSVSLAVATACLGIFATTLLGLLTLGLDTRAFAASVGVCVATGLVGVESGLCWYQERSRIRQQLDALLQERKRPA